MFGMLGISVPSHTDWMREKGCVLALGWPGQLSGQILILRMPPSLISACLFKGFLNQSHPSLLKMGIHGFQCTCGFVIYRNNYDQSTCRYIVRFWSFYYSEHMVRIPSINCSTFRTTDWNSITGWRQLHSTEIRIFKRLYNLQAVLFCFICCQLHPEHLCPIISCIIRCITGWRQRSVYSIICTFYWHFSFFVNVVCSIQNIRVRWNSAKLVQSFIRGSEQPNSSQLYLGMYSAGFRIFNILRTCLFEKFKLNFE